MTRLTNAVLVAVNLGILALMIKLYTEIFKDSAFNRRADKGIG